ncbi:uncharacterized protein LOC130678129 [Microplitis mediator]|uniref:uncharacterized protein LOC130678129 n=1 Tax=Microplitis mediator TaxID=375433 RepID=UPI00255517F1|nr:uncharacterized protein LOC130678129 [Microplitis mediator]
MAALKFIFILLFVIKNSQGFMKEIFTSTDLDSYTMNFVNNIELKLKSNCVYDYPATRFQRRFAVMNTLKDMNKIMCEFKYNNGTETFPWKSIIEKFDYFEYSYELTNMMRKISNYWKALDQSSKVNDYEGSSLMVGWGPCDNVDVQFNWKSIVDAELCNGDINAVYATFINAIKNRMEKYASKINICEIKSTLKEEMVAFFQQGIKAHIQRFILTAFELSVKSQCRESCISNEIAGLKQQFMKTIHDYQELLMKTMAGFAQFIKKCDAPKPGPCDYYPCGQPDPCDHTYPCGKPGPGVKNYNHIELERAYQTKIVNEKELSKSQSCSHNCDLSKISDLNTNGECKKYLECKFISNKYDVCEANDKKRRYEWFKTDDGATYGNGNVCYGRTTSFSSVSDFWTSFTMNSCDYCVCTCVAKPKRDDHVLTAISFREQVTDFHNERVVVGVKFVKKGFMVHLQIAEAKLLPYGRIDQSSVAWKPLEDFDYNESEQKFYVKSGYGNMKPLSLGKDYGHPSAINLDDVMAPTDYIVTGVRFRYAGDSPDCPVFQEGAIELQIQIRRFDSAEGHISDNYKPRWVSAGNSKRCELVLEEPDNPLKSYENNQLSTTNQFVKFRPSDLRKDAGQSTVPFFDASEVTGSPLMPFKGLGLYHRGNKGSGGFLALRVYDFDSRSYTTSAVNKNAPPSNSNPGFGGRMGFFQFLGNVAKFPFELTHDFFKNLRNMKEQRNEKLKGIMRDMKAMMIKNELVEKEASEFPGKVIIDKVNDYEWSSQRQISFEMTNKMIRIRNYWEVLNNYALIDYNGGDPRIGAPICAHMDLMFDWKSRVDMDFREGDINRVYADFVMTVKNKMAQYASKIKPCEIISTIEDSLIEFIQRILKSHLQRFIVAAFKLSVTSLCRNKCMSDEINEMKKILIKNLDGFDYLTELLINEYLNFKDKCQSKPSTPKPPLPGNYIELEKMYQSIIINERDLSGGTCSHDCNLQRIFQVNKNTECKKFEHCVYVSSKLDICKSNDGKRRYEWFGNNDAALKFGDNTVCNGELTSVNRKMNSWSYYSEPCDYCVCTCVAKPKHDDHVVTAMSFRKQIADVANNRVVVGVKFVKKDYMVHLQIAEAILLPGGKIDQSSAAWKPLEDFDYSESVKKFYVKSYYGNMKTLLLGKDYGHPTVVYLDDLTVYKDYIVTGVGLHYADTLDCRISRQCAIELQIQIRRFDFATGRISEYYKPTWVSAGARNRRELVLEEPDNPLKSSENNQLSSPDQFIRFRPSDLRKDAGQSTVPFLDASEAVGSPLTPLQGLGLYHRGNKGSGGFLALRSVPLNLYQLPVGEKKKKIHPRPTSSDYDCNLADAIKDMIEFPHKVANEFFDNLDDYSL